jgi:hypothetical protein
MPRGRPQFRLFDLVTWVILAGLILGFARMSWWFPGGGGRSYGSVMFLGIGFGIWSVVWSTVRAKRTGPVCENCGQRFIASGPLANSALCARCHPASVLLQSRRERAKGLMVLLLIATIVVVLAGLPLWNRVVERFGGFAWIVIPLLALGAAVGLLATVVVVIIMMSIVRKYRMRYEKYSVALARKSAGEHGTIHRSGPVTIWWCGRVDPVPMVMEQMAVVRERFERLIDEPVETPSVRVLVFDTRRAFIAYHRNVLADMGQVDCVYLGRPARSISLTTEVTRFRLHDQARSMRSGFVLYFLETYKRFLPTVSLQMGISAALAYDPGGDERGQLNRKMKVSLANDTALKAAELFPPRSAKHFLEQLRAHADHACFARLTQIRGQCWSIVEYLAGSEAPPDRLGRFRSFLSDLTAHSPQAEVFERHFGHGFDELLEEWRGWVQRQSLGPDPIRPPEIGSAIVERLIPAIRDRSNKAQDRIQAMQAMGGAGYVLGSDTLIEVLRERDDRLTPAAVWALESISGRAWGNDADRWAEWWSGLDPEAVRELELVERR